MVGRLIERLRPEQRLRDLLIRQRGEVRRRQVGERGRARDRFQQVTPLDIEPLPVHVAQRRAEHVGVPQVAVDQVQQVGDRRVRRQEPGLGGQLARAILIHAGEGQDVSPLEYLTGPAKE